MKRRQEDEAARLAQQEKERLTQAAAQAEAEKKRLQYLVDNVRQLNLIPYKGWTEVPGIWDWLPTYLQYPVGSLLEDRAGVPIPTDVLKAIGGLYNILGAMLDPCTALGSRKTVERLQNMTNPKTNQKYTLAEAITKTDQMCSLLRHLKAKVEAQNRAGK